MREAVSTGLACWVTPPGRTVLTGCPPLRGLRFAPLGTLDYRNFLLAFVGNRPDVGA